jgi:predicted nucleic acid-binding protein
VILYLDASAAVKRYVTEPGTAEVHQAIEAFSMVGTGLISRAEIAAALVTFDRRLWESARQSGLFVFPDDLPAMLAAWSSVR